MENKSPETARNQVKIKQAKRRKSLEKALRDNLKRRKQAESAPVEKPRQSE